MCGYVKLALGHGPINNARKKGIRRHCSDLILGITSPRLLCFLDSLQLLCICVLVQKGTFNAGACLVCFLLKQLLLQILHPGEPKSSTF